MAAPQSAVADKVQGLAAQAVSLIQLAASPTSPVQATPSLPIWSLAIAVTA